MRAPRPFPRGGRRLSVYATFNRRGGVEPYVLLALAALRSRSERVLVVVNGEVQGSARSELEAAADEVLVRPNEGFDIGAYQAAITHLGPAAVTYDEILLCNDSWYGPVRGLGDVFARMDDRAVDFWGMTDHDPDSPNPLTGVGSVPAHLQSHWIAVRRSMLESPEWDAYWRDLPVPTTYEEAVLGHEIRFTGHFESRGFTSAAAFPASGYPTTNPSLFSSELLLRDGCPIVKRRVFFHPPEALDRASVVSRRTFDAMEAAGFPMSAVLADVSRNVAPRVANTNLALMEVLGAGTPSLDEGADLRLVVIAHIFYPEMTGEMLRRAGHLPGLWDLVITTPDETRAAAIQEEVDRRGLTARADVRVVESNDGREQSAFLIGCRDVLTSGRYDLVVKIHSKKTPQDGYTVGRHFAHQQLDNLLGSPETAAGLVGLFRRDPGLGIAYPPMIHVGYPTLGRAWWSNKEPFRRLAEKLGVRVPLDEISPLAPFGSMYAARPEALRILVDAGWSYSDFGGADAYHDGGLAHVLERFPTYAAAELGYHTRTVVTPEYLSVSHSSLEYLFREVSSVVPGKDAFAKTNLLRTGGFLGSGRLSEVGRLYMRVRHPGTGAEIRRLRARFGPRRVLRGLKNRLRRLGRSSLLRRG